MITRTVTVISVLIAAACNWLLFYQSVDYTPTWYAVFVSSWTLGGLFVVSWWLYGFGRAFDVATRTVCHTMMLLNVAIAACGVVLFIAHRFEPRIIAVRAIVPAALTWLLVEIAAAICLPPLLATTMTEIHEIEDRRTRLTRAQQSRNTTEEFPEKYLAL